MVGIYRIGQFSKEFKEELGLYGKARVILDEQGVHYGDIMVPGNPLHDLVQTLREPVIATSRENPCGEIPIGPRE